MIGLLVVIIFCVVEWHLAHGAYIDFQRNIKDLEKKEFNRLYKKLTSQHMRLLSRGHYKEDE